MTTIPTTTATESLLREAAADARAELRESFYQEAGRDPLTGGQDLPDPVTPYAEDGSEGVRPQLMGYCYQNAREMSGQLLDRGITHEVYYLGITMDVVQFIDGVTHGEYKDAKAADSVEDVADTFPTARANIPDEANHYAVLVDAENHDLDGDGYWLAEPFSELRDHYGDMYVGSFPDGYIRPDDGAVEPWERDPSWHWNPRDLEVYPEDYYEEEQ